MKKTITLIGIYIISLSCNSENQIIETKNTQKSIEMENFSNAFKSLGNPENRATEEEKRSGSSELSDRRKKILIPASIDLIKSTGVKEREIQAKTNGDITAIILWATEINLKKNKEISRKIKFEN